MPYFPLLEIWCKAVFLIGVGIAVDSKNINSNKYPVAAGRKE